MVDAANNQSGTAGVGAGLGVGIGAGAGMGYAFGGQMAQGMAGGMQPNRSCPNCGSLIAASSTFCPNCGASLQQQPAAGEGADVRAVRLAASGRRQVLSELRRCGGTTSAGRCVRADEDLSKLRRQRLGEPQVLPAVRKTHVGSLLRDGVLSKVRDSDPRRRGLLHQVRRCGQPRRVGRAAAAAVAGRSEGPRHRADGCHLHEVP